MANMEPLEVEVKFFLSEVEPIRNTILGLGAKAFPRGFETNIRFEDANESFVRRKMLLRLRTDTKTTLTLKSPPPESDPNFKVNMELEVEVSDFNTMEAILQGMGFHRTQCYEKWRQTLVLGNTIFCIDTLPFGNFLEIEGAKAVIPDLSGRIGLQWSRRILFNYLEIFEFLKREHDLPFTDVTFENFENCPVDLEPYRHHFEKAAPPEK